MIKLTISGIIMILAIQACSLLPGSKKTVKEVSMPAWVLNPPVETSENIYGIGSGFTYNQAKEAALKDIASKLIIEVSSQSKSEVSQFNKNVSSSANQQINTRTIETQLSDYKILQSEQVGSEIFMQIGMSRSGFIKKTSSRLKEIDDKIKIVMRELPSKTKLQQLIAIQDIEPSIAKARRFVLLLQAAGSPNKTDKYLSYYNNVLKKSNSLLYNVRFNVSSDSNTKDFAKHLVALMSNKNISASISNKANADVYINVKGTIKSSVMFSQNISQLKVRIKISDKRKRVISVKEYESSGSSPGSVASSVESAIKSMGDKFKNNGILESLGLVKNNV